MQRVDINHDGVIQLTEFVAGLVDWKQLQNDTQWGQWVQVRGRRAGTPRLLRGVLPGCRAQPPPRRNPPHPAPSPPSAPAPQMAFDRLDGNGDGWLSLDELMEQLPADGSTDAGAWRTAALLVLLQRCCRQAGGVLRSCAARGCKAI